MKGMKGKLYGEMSAFIGEFEDCPQLDAAIKRTGKTMPDFKTSVIEIDGEKDLDNIELNFPFSSCKLVKELENLMNSASKGRPQ